MSKKIFPVIGFVRVVVVFVVLNFVKILFPRVGAIYLPVDLESGDVPVKTGVGFNEIIELSQSIPNVFRGQFFRVGGI